MNQCPTYFDYERIARNWKACGAPPRNLRGGGDVGNGGRGRGGGGGHGRIGRHVWGRGDSHSCCSNYGQGGFSLPAKNKTVCIVNSKDYSACKDCGCNSGERAHTSDRHEIYSMRGYSVTFALKTKMNNLLGAADGSSGSDHTSGSGSGYGGVNSLAVTMVERCFIIDEEDSDPGNVAFAGKSGRFLQSLM